MKFRTWGAAWILVHCYEITTYFEPDKYVCLSLYSWYSNALLQPDPNSEVTSEDIRIVLDLITLTPTAEPTTEPTVPPVVVNEETPDTNVTFGGDDSMNRIARQVNEAEAADFVTLYIQVIMLYIEYGDTSLVPST